HLQRRPPGSARAVVRLFGPDVQRLRLRALLRSRSDLSLRNQPRLRGPQGRVGVLPAEYGRVRAPARPLRERSRRPRAVPELGRTMIPLWGRSSYVSFEEPRGRTVWLLTDRQGLGRDVPSDALAYLI